MTDPSSSPRPNVEDLLAVVGALAAPWARAATARPTRQSGTTGTDALRESVTTLAGGLADQVVAVVGTSIAEGVTALSELLLPSPATTRSTPASERPAPETPATKTTAASAPAPAAGDVPAHLVTVDVDDVAQVGRLRDLLDPSLPVAHVREALRSLRDTRAAARRPVLEEPADPAVRVDDRHGVTWAAVGDRWISTVGALEWNVLAAGRGPLVLAAP